MKKLLVAVLMVTTSAQAMAWCANQNDYACRAAEAAESQAEQAQQQRADQQMYYDNQARQQLYGGQNYGPNTNQQTFSAYGGYR
tara:strand:- start:400 stop:651 length:252 start_codon:yes stop_codon:yes gene_type:complete